jgi:hypothetical protein
VSEKRSSPPPPVFWQKSPESIENKGKTCGKERKERTKSPQAAESMRFAAETTERQDTEPLDGRDGWGDTRGFCMDVNPKGLRGKGFVSI